MKLNSFNDILLSGQMVIAGNGIVPTDNSLSFGLTMTGAAFHFDRMVCIEVKHKHIERAIDNIHQTLENNACFY